MKGLQRFTYAAVAFAALMVIIQGCHFGGSSSSATGSTTTTATWEPYLVLKPKSDAAAVAIANLAREHMLAARGDRSFFRGLFEEAYAAVTGTTQCPGIGTILGGDGNAIAQNAYQVASCTGVLYGITAAGNAQRLTNGATIWYDAANCTGNAWVAPDGVGGPAQAAGAFFTVDPTVSTPDSVPGTYLMVTPGQAEAQVNALSGYVEGVSACSNFGAPNTVTRWEAAPNSATVTGMASAQVAGGVTSATP